MFTQTLINYLLVGLVTNMNKSPKHLEVETLKKKKKAVLSGSGNVYSRQWNKCTGIF